MKFWLQIIALHIATALLIALGLVLLTSDSARAEYYGARWKTTTICVQNQINDPVIRQSLYEAIVQYRDKTNLHIVNYGSSSCTAARYSQIIYAVDNYYGKSANWSGTVYFGGFDWGKTNKGWWTYFYRSGVKLQFNQSHPQTENGWEHVTAHELAHALSLNENHDTCNSVVAYGCKWLDKPTSVDYNEINYYYSK